MRTSDKGMIALIGHEGIVPGPYADSVGVITYGVGHTAAAGSPNPADMVPGMPSNLDAELVRVFTVFRRDLHRYEQAVDAAIKVPVTQFEFDAAVSFHFNTGAIGRASWVKDLNAGNSTKASAGIMNWRKPPEIIPRRKSEQALFRTGVYPEASINVWNVSKSGKVIWTVAKRLSPADALLLLRGSTVPDAPLVPGDIPGCLGGDRQTPNKATGLGAAIAAGAAALIVAAGSFACKIPFLNTLFSTCGGQ